MLTYEGETALAKQREELLSSVFLVMKHGDRRIREVRSNDNTRRSENKRSAEDNDGAGK